MSTVTRPRGPLPARVYWTRRLLVLVVALLLVFAVARLLGGSGGSDPSARPVGATTKHTASGSVTPTPTGTPSISPPVTVTGSPTPTPTLSGAGTATPAAPLASPTGACANNDLIAVPATRGRAYAGRAVVLDVALTTRSASACTWVVSANSLVVKVTSGADDVWSTQQCVGAVLKQSIVVRKDVATPVAVAWNGQRSDVGCTRSTAWAQPGYYHMAAAAFGSDPTDVQFRLWTPKPRTVIKTPTPTPSPKAAPKSGPGSKATATPTPRQVPAKGATKPS